MSDTEDKQNSDGNIPVSPAVIADTESEDIAKRVFDWDEVRRHAETRPAMYIGDQSTAHRGAILECLRLVWQAKVFRRPQSITIDLSPTQYIVRAECGPLLRPIQQHFHFGTGETLEEPWREDMQAYDTWLADYEEQKSVKSSRFFRHDWRYCFSGPTGPRLNSADFPQIFANRMVWGLRTDVGFWCQAHKNSRPMGRPIFLKQTSPIGLIAAADLDPHWFTGLPFTEADLEFFTGLSGKQYKRHPNPKYEPRPLWTPGKIVARWHPQNDIVSDRTLTADGLTELIKTPE